MFMRMGNGWAHLRISGRQPKRCHHCKFVSEYQCDYPTSKGKTCDRHLCSDHARRQPDVAPLLPGLECVAGFEAETRDYCPEHHELVHGPEDSNASKPGPSVIPFRPDPRLR
jgi:hypothetical protein